jgi:hypothetical protein
MSAAAGVYQKLTVVTKEIVCYTKESIVKDISAAI